LFWKRGRKTGVRLNVVQAQKREEIPAERKQQQPAVLKFAAEGDVNDEKLAVKTLRNNAAAKLRNRSLSAGQKVRLKHSTTQRRRLLSHGRAVEIIRRKRAASLPTPTQPATDSSIRPTRTPDKSSPESVCGLQKVRAGVFERSWVDTTADDATATPVDQSRSSSVAEDVSVVTDWFPSPAEDTVTSSLTGKTAEASDVEDVSSQMELSVPDEDVSSFMCLVKM